MSTTVRQAPLMATLSPSCVPSMSGGVQMVSRRPGPEGWTCCTTPSVSTRPVNTIASYGPVFCYEPWRFAEVDGVPCKHDQATREGSRSQPQIDGGDADLLRPKTVEDCRRSSVKGQNRGDL